MNASAFAIQGGEPLDAAGLIQVDTSPRPRQNRRLILGVEPIEPSARGLELADLARRTLQEVFHAAHALPPAAALMKAFTAANAVLINENRPAAGCRWERRVYIGATGIVITGNELIMAQVPPTAALIVQDEHLYAFPELASWRDDYQFPTDDPEPDPLGCRESLRPYLFRSTVQPGDLIVLGATGLIRQLGRGPAAATSPLLAGDPEDALDALAALAVQHELDAAHAAAIQLRHVGTSRGFRPRPLARPPRARTAPRWPAASAMLRAGNLHAPAGGGTWQPGRRTATAVPFAVRIDWQGVGVPLDRPLAATMLPSPAAPNSSSAGPQPQLPLPPMRDAFGARAMRRYREQRRLPVEWQTPFPRGVTMRLPARLGLLGVAGLLAFGGAGSFFDRYQAQTVRATAALTAVDGSLAAITADPATGPAALAAAEAALAEARTAGADSATIARRAAAVEAARDQMPGIGRLSDVTRLGALPAALGDGPISLVRTGTTVWLVGAALYSYDAATGQLVEVLAPGDAVKGGIVGQLSAAAADDGGLILRDETALFHHDATGRWVRTFLAPGATTAGAPLATFQGSVYSLDAGSNLTKLDASDLAGHPDRWADAATHPDLHAAIDLAIDGRIHVLLQDGRVVTFFRRQLTAAVLPAVSPAIGAPTQLLGGTDTNFLYIVEPGARVGLTTGRLIRLDAEGNAAQLLPPAAAAGTPGEAAAHILAECREMVIDEANGVIYFITDGELWRASLPA